MLGIHELLELGWGGLVCWGAIGQRRITAISPIPTPAKEYQGQSLSLSIKFGSPKREDVATKLVTVLGIDERDDYINRFTPPFSQMGRG